MTRTILKTKGKNGIPSFHSPDKIVSAKLFNIFNQVNGIQIKNDGIEGDSIKYDFKNGLVTVNYKKHSYIPFNVYKILLKIAISSVFEDDVENYNDLIKILSNPNDSLSLSHWAPIFKTTSTLNGPMNSPPLVFLFKKENPELAFPTHCIVLFYGNMIFQVYLPFNADDIKSGCKQFFSPFCPPFSHNHNNSDKQYQISVVDLQSNELKKGEDSNFQMTVDKNIKTDAKTFL